MPQRTEEADLSADLEELKMLMNLAKRESVKAILSRAISSVKTNIETASAASMETDEPPPTPLAPSIVVPSYATALSEGNWTSVSTFAFDAGEYNSKSLSIYVTLEGVGEIDKANVSCDFTKGSFDLKVVGLSNKNYRLFKDNLAHEIDVSKCKFTVKKDKVVIRLGKKKGEYSYDHWTDLTSKKSKEAASKAKKDPSASIMDMMKDMYDSGDDQMKKTIGEAMLKSRSGEKVEPPAVGDMEM